jgi:short-subunit dehydrogenase
MVVLTRLLAEELAGTGVKLTVVCPGIVRSEFHSRQGIDMTGRPRMEPEAVVQASLIALDRGEIVCIPTLEDPELLTARDDAQSQIVRSAASPNPAKRYS